MRLDALGGSFVPRLFEWSSGHGFCGEFQTGRTVSIDYTEPGAAIDPAEVKSLSDCWWTPIARVS
jgi:hypothetical protein